VNDIEHPDCYAWCWSLIVEWTGREPVFSVSRGCGRVMAMVMPYCSQAGILHDTPTCAFGETCEQALLALSDRLYADLENDLGEVNASLIFYLPEPSLISGW
jgi:hypothetical protein